MTSETEHNHQDIESANLNIEIHVPEEDDRFRWDRLARATRILRAVMVLIIVAFVVWLVWLR